MKIARLFRRLSDRPRRVAIALALVVSGIAVAGDPIADSESFTTRETGTQAYSVTVAAIPEHLRQSISSGRRMFQEPWVLPTQYTGVWGIGPTFNENSCPACHENNGRARAPGSRGEIAAGLILRLSVPANDGAPQPHPHYGDQFQNRGVKGQVPAEGKALVRYESLDVKFADGERISLRKPIVEFTELAFGPLAKDTMVSARVAPSLAGLGLLEAIPEETLLQIAKQQPAQGLNGKPNYVWDVEAKQLVLGRFGWKANQPSLRQQIAAAFHADIGATSSLYPAENCPDIQTECLKGPSATGCSGGRGKCDGEIFWEVLPSRLRNVTLYLQALAVPAQREANDPTVRQGEKLFADAQCAGCHLPELKTGTVTAIPAAASLSIRPYTDLLLHDMGDGLADGRPDFLANGSQWRTAPLWGLGLQKTVNAHTDFLHDGRARNLVEAIVWHGGEAQSSRDRFLAMNKREREALLKFLESL
ncbi:MAG: di-heme oxidoredictase family protein [Burkholderiales bacterium]